MQAEEPKTQQADVTHQSQIKQEEAQPEPEKTEQFIRNPLSFQSAKQNYIERFQTPLVSLIYGQKFTIKIETKRLILESMGLDDAYCLHKYLWGQPNVMKLFATGCTKTLEETEKRVVTWDQRWKNEDPFAGMSVRNRHSGDYVGYIVMGHGDEQNSSEIAYGFKESEWNKGYGYESIGATVLFLGKILSKNNFKVNGNQEFKRVIATSNILNPASQKILEKLGFSVYKQSEKWGSKRNHFELRIE